MVTHCVEHPEGTVDSACNNEHVQNKNLGDGSSLNLEY